MTTKLIGALPLLLAATFLPAAHADGDLPAYWETVDDQTLAQMRGGFVTSAGGQTLELSFGIERAVYVNGELVTKTALIAPQFAGGGVPQNIQIGNVSLVQNGAGNAFSAKDLMDAMPANVSSGSLTVIQNSLDNQVIKQVTTINAGVNSLSIARDINLGSVVNRQIVNSIR